MQPLDWTIIIAYFAGSAAVGAYYARRAGRDTGEFFLSGRSMPWWLAGTSMVATTFAADTPLAVTELVAKNGIAGNWLWWNFVFGGVLTVFFFARLWRRSGIMTDVEFAELRYAGRPAAFLRGFRAVYLGLFLNCIIMGWVNLAMASVLQGMFGVPPEQVMWYVVGALALTAVYSAMSGLWGVTVTDALQFVLAMAGCIVLADAVLDLPQVGGLAGLRSALPEWAFRFTPSVGGDGLNAGGAFALTVSAFLAFVGVQWWSSWYPGSEPGGGGFVAQRMMSAKDERHSLFATLWFIVAHYCLRPWPWIIVGLASLVLYPELGPDEKRLGYVYAMRDHLPTGLKGLLVAGFFAAYMSTVATQLNWGSSYIVNDVYRRFIRPAADERSLVRVSRVTTLVIMAVSVGVTSVIGTISGAWTFIIEASAGLGLVLILRWYWWRINAWSEITAMTVPLGIYYLLTVFGPVPFPGSLFLIVGGTTLAWLAATFLTPPEPAEKLDAFFTRVRPGGPGWRAVAARLPQVRADGHFGASFVCWGLGIVLIYAALFGTGELLFGSGVTGALLFLLSALCGAGIVFILKRQEIPLFE